MDQDSNSEPSLARVYRLSGETWRQLAIYLILVVSVLTLVALSVHRYGPDLIEIVLHFLLPENWLFAGRTLVERMLDAQSLAVLINTGMATVIMLVSLITFPLKERVSASYEQDTQCTGARAPNEPPLWRQALEECELGVFYLALTLMVLRLGLSEDEAARQTSVVLSHILLAMTMAIDYISPTLQRHGLTYTDILATLARHPVKSLGFGVVFAAGPVAGGHILINAGADPVMVFIALGVIHTISLAGAVLVGTLVGGQLTKSALEADRVGQTPRLATWLLITTTLIINGVFFGSAGQTFYALTPILKCEWSVVDGSFKVHEKKLLPPSLVLGAMVTIYNPTDRVAALGAHQIDVLFKGESIADTQLTQFEVRPGERITQDLRVRIRQRGGLVHGLLKSGTSIKQRGVGETFNDLITAAHYSAQIVFPTPVGDLPIFIK